MSSWDDKRQDLAEYILPDIGRSRRHVLVFLKLIGVKLAPWQEKRLRRTFIKEIK